MLDLGVTIKERRLLKVCDRPVKVRGRYEHTLKDKLCGVTFAKRYDVDV